MSIDLRTAFRRFFFPPACPACDAPTSADRLCADCLRGVALHLGARAPVVPGVDRLLVPCRYEGSVRALIVRLKYGGDRRPLGSLVELLCTVIRDSEASGRPDAVVPIPLSFGRRRRRGFNQAELLARALAARLGVPCLPHALRKKGGRPPQASLDREHRLSNAAYAFTDGVGVFGRAVLLVDDVATTGATLADAARALRAGGARRVTAAVAACVD